MRFCCGSLLPLPSTVRSRAKGGELLLRNVLGFATLNSVDPLGVVAVVGVDGRAPPALGLGATFPTVRCFGLAHAQTNSSSAASTTMPTHVSPIITGQNAVAPPPSSNGSPDSGDTGTGGAGGAGGAGVMSGGDCGWKWRDGGWQQRACRC